MQFYTQVDENMLLTTQSQAAKSYLQNNFIDIKSAFGIDWTQVTWQDLRMPFYSGLAARLYLHYSGRNEQAGIPRDLESQAKFWVKYYRPAGDEDHFITLAEQLDKGALQ